MTIKEFIETAIEGGYNPNLFEESDSHYSSCWSVDSVGGFDVLIPEIVLDPEAWRAVGKVKGWNSKEKGVIHVASFPYEEWEWKMVQMIFALLKGQILEEYIATL